MKTNSIFYIYCSQQDVAALSDIGKLLKRGYRFDIVSTSSNVSSQKIYSNHKKQRNLALGDFIILLDNIDLLEFDKSFKNDQVLFFRSLLRFSDWCNENYIDKIN